MTRQETETSDQDQARVEVSIPAPDPDLFRHTATDDLLRLLSDNPYEQFTIRQLGRLTENAAQSVKRAVDVLETNGIVTVSTEGNRRLVGINRTRVRKSDDPVLRIPQPEFHRPIRAALDRVRDEIGELQGALVFGSVARGRADRQSDIDLWVLTDDRTDQHRANELAKDLGEQRFDGDRYEFQILVETPESARGHGDRLEEVFADAITLVDSEELRDLKREVMSDA
ncbi:nucleotidyltransferase domain-containing protein [Halobaculum magnesiiphilum]|uniref:Nucleotidyltransferase domain-containing protein n=1 Tax=Halobaculum magnesiiphilum TaxID=1017351 RepID=A0A8T8WEF9_9EURY|nr:nucleotidyltransferase domain-containing protein [Halobaculum magnesiiphilum]QZP38228.1 nucleotidyltransferase domain-containing protein [Halobaculum magnesiiphilum]